MNLTRLKAQANHFSTVDTKMKSFHVTRQFICQGRRMKRIQGFIRLKAAHEQHVWKMDLILFCYFQREDRYVKCRRSLKIQHACSICFVLHVARGIAHVLDVWRMPRAIMSWACVSFLQHTLPPSVHTFMHANRCGTCAVCLCVWPFVSFTGWTYDILCMHKARVSNSQADLSVAMVTSVSSLFCQ